MNIKNLLLNIIGIIIWLLSNLFYKTRKYILIENCNGKYADSVKEVYENLDYPYKYFVVNSKTTFKTLKSQQKSVLLKGSAKYFYYLAKSKVYVTNTMINYEITHRLDMTIVSIFHGFGTKKTPSHYELKYNYQRFYKDFNNLDYIICLSDRDKTYFGDGVIEKEDIEKKFLPLGLPRNDIFFNDSLREKLLKKYQATYCFEKYNKIILYAPTWREVVNKKPSEYLWPFNRVETKQLLGYLEKNNYLLVIRPHPYFNKYTNEIDQIIIEHPNTKIITNHDIEDSQEILLLSDILITDYSSIFVDFLLLNRPIFYLDIDLKEYLDSRGLCIDYYNDLHTPGWKVRNMDHLLHHLKQLDRNIDDYQHIRNESRAFYHKFLDGYSTKRVCDFIYSLLR